jgi:isocitrate dehydrogenase
MTKTVALIRGDGTGPELIDSALAVLKAVGADLDFRPVDAGFDWWQKHGGNSLVSAEGWSILESTDACFKAPTTTPAEPGSPRSVAVSIRQRFELYANVRPIKTFPNTAGPLGDVDFILVREGTEGLYAGLENRLNKDLAIAFRKVSRASSERVARKAFEIARSKDWRNVIVVTKRNILRETDGLFFESVSTIHKDFPELTLVEYYIDNFSQQLVKNPQRFNQHVIVGTNLFMDILSEEASGLIGSIGCVYSGNFGDRYAMFEPAHGSSPKYAGQDKVNPTATILAGAWMLEYFGEKRKSEAIFNAMSAVIGEGKRVTYDLGGAAKMSEMTAAVADEARTRL